MVDFKKLSKRMSPNGYSYFRELTHREDYYSHVPTRYLVLDTETTGTKLFHGCQAFAVSAVDHNGESFYWRFKVNAKTRKVIVDRPTLKKIDDVASSYSHHVFHHGKFDVRALQTIGIDLTKLQDFWLGFRDTLLYSHVCDSTEEHGLKALAKKYLKVSDDDEKALHTAVIKARRANKKLGNSTAEKVQEDYFLAGDELDTYALSDVVDRTEPLFRMYCEVVRGEKLAYQVAREHALVPLVFNMETQGIRIRTKTLGLERSRYSKQAVEEGTKALKIAVSSGMPKDFNPRSSQQLQTLLFDKYKLPVGKSTKSGANSTDAETLKDLLDGCGETSKAGKFLSSLLLSRKSYKACDYLTEYQSLCVNGILHPSFNQTGTNTTRFSSSDPNAQNVSTKSDMPLRIVFGPREGCYWFDNDYDNLEMRLFAYACGEEELIKAFELGESVHLVIAEELNGPRAKWKELNNDDWKKSPEYKRTKNGNFALIYGAGINRADATYGVTGAFERIRKRFKKLASFMQTTIDKAKANGYVETMFGYRLSVPQDRAYAALNYFIQGTAGCVMKYAMLAFAEDADISRLSGRMLMTVHDELISEFPENEDQQKLIAANAVKRAMESPGVRIGIPLTVSPSVIYRDWTKPKEIQTTFVSQF